MIYYMHKFKKIILISTLLYFSCFFNQASAYINNEIDLAGFVDLRIGARIKNDPLQKDTSISEFRLQTEIEKEISDVTLTVVLDFLLDSVSDEYAPDYDTGEGVIDPRQLNIFFSVLENIDVKIGRQILTWGTGDLLFINDLFPKDFLSFFIGRDNEYLKAPSDAIKFSVFFEKINVDIVYMPKFNADRSVDGTRISFYDRLSSSSRGRENTALVDRPNDWFDDDELAIRLYRSISGMEVAMYYYHGFWKSPAATNPTTSKVSFPELQVLGASLRMAMLSGISNLEFGVYKSGEEEKYNPLSRNSEFRLLLGFEKEIAIELNLGLQYYLEHRLNYNAYLLSLPDEFIVDDENRSIVTLRLTKLLLQQNMEISLFNYYSPSDNDGYIRINGFYKLSDDFKIEAGINHFYGDEVYTLFSQFKQASNIYTAFRYEF